MSKKQERKQQEIDNWNEKPYINYREGDIFFGHKIKKIYCCTSNYLIFQPCRYKGSIVSSDRFAENKKLSPISAKLTIIKGLKRKLKKSSEYDPFIASAMVECYEGNIDKSLEILEEIENSIKKDFVNEAKVDYILCSTIIVMINLIIIATLKFLSFEGDAFIKEFFKIATFGSFGGLISTLSKINKLDFKEHEDKYLLCFLSISRLSISMISSVIAYILIKSNLVFGVVNESNNQNVYLIFAVLAGFSETFIPDMLTRIEQDQKQK
jgi:hypothetical protein